MASSSSCSSSAAPKLIIPEDKTSGDINDSHPSFATSESSTTNIPKSSGIATKILSTQLSVDRHHHPIYPIAKRFSIDADPSCVILNTPAVDLINHSSTLDDEETPSINTSLSVISSKEVSPARSSTLQQSDSFLEIPYEKGEIVDLIKLADDPNSAAHITNDGQEVLLEHGTIPQ